MHRVTDWNERYRRGEHAALAPHKLLVRVTETVDPANYDCTAIIKHLDALKKFPVVVFERPLDYRLRADRDICRASSR